MPQQEQTGALDPQTEAVLVRTRAWPERDGEAGFADEA
jgi:hypothetical protein